MPPPSVSGGANQDEELEDLERKFAQLEGDRRSFFETSRWTIKQNRDTLAIAKRENKELRGQLLARGSTRGSPSSDAEDLAKLTVQLAEARRKNDELKQLAAKKAVQLKQKLDKVKELQLNTQNFDDGEDPAMRGVRLLENRLDKALTKHNEALAIHKTYVLIAKRLREERIGFNNQLQALERTLKAKEHDLQELVLLSHEAIHAKEVAKVELSTADQDLASERAARERDLTEWRAHVRSIEEAQAEQERRDREAAEAAAARAALEAEANPQRRNDGGANNSAPSATPDGERWREEEERRLSAYEDAFRRIKEATGVSDVTEVISKFLTAEDTATHLKTLTREAQARIDGLLEARDDAKRAVEEARYAGTVAAAERKAVDELEVQLVEARAQQERLKQRHDRMAKILLAIRAGVSHLCGKLDALRARTADGRRSSAASIGTVPGADEDLVVQLFRQVETKLMHAVEALKDVEGADKTALSDPAHIASMTFLALEDVELKPGNLRVGARAYASDEEEDAEDMDMDGGDDVLDRDTVKSSANALQHKNRGGGKFKSKEGGRDAGKREGKGDAS